MRPPDGNKKPACEAGSLHCKSSRDCTAARRRPSMPARRAYLYLCLRLRLLRAEYCRWRLAVEFGEART